MTMTFGDAHLDTLTKLKVLVEKHGMKIRFGTKSDFTNDSDSSVLEEFKVSKEIIDVFDNLDIFRWKFQLHIRMPMV